MFVTYCNKGGYTIFFPPKWTDTYEPMEFPPTRVNNTKTPLLKYTNVITPKRTETLTYDYSQTVSQWITLIYDIRGDNNPCEYLDLDTMTIDKKEESDIHYSVTIGSNSWIWIQPINGAKLF